jgi:hypothetical protein
MRGFTITHTGFGGSGVKVEGTFTGQDLIFRDMLEATSPGAGVYVTDGVATLLDVTFDALATTTDGGAIAVDEDGILTLLGARITNTSASQYGGAIYVRDAVLDAVDVLIDGLAGPVTAMSGGGIYVATTGEVSLIDTTIQGAFASLDGGGLFTEERARKLYGTNLALLAMRPSAMAVARLFRAKCTSSAARCPTTSPERAGGRWCSTMAPPPSWAR